MVGIVPIEVTLTGVTKHVNPCLGQVIRVIRGHGGIELIVNNVELWGDVLGLKIPD
jgi:hypothetical protein